MLVVDASALVPLLVAETQSAAARAIAEAEADLVAPELILAEALNALWKKQRLGQIGDAERLEAIALIGPPLLRLAAMAPLARRASALARDLDHPVYDCFYLAHAEREGVQLLTADARLIGRLAGTARASLCRPLASTHPGTGP